MYVATQLNSVLQKPISLEVHVMSMHMCVCVNIAQVLDLVVRECRQFFDVEVADAATAIDKLCAEGILMRRQQVFSSDPVSESSPSSTLGGVSSTPSSMGDLTEVALVPPEATAQDMDQSTLSQVLAKLQDTSSVTGKNLFHLLLLKLTPQQQLHDLVPGAEDSTATLASSLSASSTSKVPEKAQTIDLPSFENGLLRLVLNRKVTLPQSFLRATTSDAMVTAPAPAAPAAPPAGGGAFGAQPAGGGGFGAPAAGGGAFGAKPAGGGGFGAPAASGAFGAQPAGGGAFGAQPAGGGGFGAQPAGGGAFGAPAAGGGAFGAPAGGGAFGAQPAGGGGFGAPAAGGGAFGAKPAGGGGFGAPAAGGGAFGAQPAGGGGFGAPAAGGGAFGAPAAGGGGFGAPAASGAFGAPAAGGGGFGAPPAAPAFGAAPAAASSFGQAAGGGGSPFGAQRQQQRAGWQDTAGKFAVTTENQQSNGQYSGTLGYHCLTVQPQFADVSFEECRVNDYELGGRTRQPQASGALVANALAERSAPGSTSEEGIPLGALVASLLGATADAYALELDALLGQVRNISALL